MKRSSKRTDRVKYVDPVTGLTEYRYVEKITYRYDEEEKRPIVIEYLAGEISAEKMVEKYHICSVQTLYACLVIAGNHYHKYENIVKDVIPTRPNEIWVSDITYV